MFNVYLYHNKCNEYVANKAHKQKEEEQRRLHVKRRAHLCKNYRRRVDEFIADMYDKPIVNSPSSNTASQFLHRPEDSSKFLGSPTFKFTTFKTERERIAEALKEQEHLETKPLTGKFELRSRELKKEIQPKMRFTPKSGYERVIDSLDRNGVTDLKREHSNHRSTDSTIGLSSTTRGFKSTSVDPRSLRADLHRKTHFKAATTISLGQGGVLSATNTESNKIVETFLEEESTKNEGGLLERQETTVPKLRKLGSQSQSHNLARTSIYRQNPRGITFIDPILSPKSPKIPLKSPKPRQSLLTTAGKNSHNTQSLPSITIADVNRQSIAASETTIDTTDLDPLTTNTNRRKSQTVDHLAKLILGTCNVTNHPNPTVKTLHKGQGHLSINGTIGGGGKEYIRLEDGGRYNVSMVAKGNHGGRGRRAIR